MEGRQEGVAGECVREVAKAGAVRSQVLPGCSRKTVWNSPQTSPKEYALFFIES